MNMCLYDLGDAPRQKIPHDNAAIIAAHCQKSSKTVEIAGDGHSYAIQSTIILFWIVLSK